MTECTNESLGLGLYGRKMGVKQGEIHLSPDEDQWQAIANMVIRLTVP